MDRPCRGHGFECRSSLNIFFRLSFRNCFSCVLTGRIFLLFDVHLSQADGRSDLPAGVGQVVYQTLKSDISAASKLLSKEDLLDFGIATVPCDGKELLVGSCV